MFPDFTKDYNFKFVIFVVFTSNFYILVINDKTICVGAARIGWSDEKFITTTLRRMADEVDLGQPLHSLVIVGQLHPLEIDYLKIHTIDSSFDQLALENNESLNLSKK